MSQYKPGGNFPTVNVTNASATVTVLGVDATAEIDVGDTFFVNGAFSGRYDVASRSYSSPNTTVTLTAPYAGATAAGAIGVFHRDFTSGLNLPLPYDGDLEFAALNRRQMELVDQFFQNPVWTSSTKAQVGNAISMLVGADSTGTTVTNSTNKIGRLGIPHYLTAEEPVGAIFGNSQSSTNQVAIGGGSSLFNAATLVEIYTGATTTTQTGTRRTYWNSAGRMLVGEPTDDSTCLAQFNGRIKATDFTTAGNYISINDDTAINFTAPNGSASTGFILVVSSNVSTRNAILWMRPNTGGASTATLYAGSDVVVTTGVLSGTTGTDAKLNISAHTDGKIYIENRAGSAIRVNYIAMAAT